MQRGSAPEPQTWFSSFTNGQESASLRTMEEEQTHRKRLAQILRYISSMHHSLSAAEGNVVYSFVRQAENDAENPSSFFQREREDELMDDQRCGVLFSTEDFRHLLAMQNAKQASPLFESPPFSFYAAAASSSSSRKRTLTGTLKSAFSSADSPMGAPEKACWLRITRLTSSQLANPPRMRNAAVRAYLQDWLTKAPSQVRSIDQLLTSRGLAHAPKIAPTVDARGSQEIKSFLRKYKKFLRKKTYQQLLEPMYNRLFEWIQQQQDHHDELVWGLGHARILIGDTWVNGPLLEVLMEVELAQDGALLVRPREHTGVALNREVVSALKSGDAAPASHSVLSHLHQTVAELEPSHLSPGQPSTYVSLLKRIAVELSPGGSFQSSAVAIGDPKKLVVSEAWCLFSRPKPSSVWARDAMAFGDQLMLPNPTNLLLPQASFALTYGPGSLDIVIKGGEPDDDYAKDTLLDRFYKGILGKKDDHSSSIAKPIFPLPMSDAQNRIADLLLNKNYPAVVCEGPPGTGKTHSIANVVCAYLCQGKRVLVTSKNAPALSVLRNRLPSSVQELCVDVSMSELAGMRQLQQTVERLANRVSCVSTEMENEKVKFLKRNIDELEQQLSEIDEKLSKQSDKIRRLVQQPNGQAMVDLSLSLIDEAPWLSRTIATWTVKEVVALKDRVVTLVLEENDPIESVSGFAEPPEDALISLVAAQAGATLPTLANAAKSAVASVPVLGSLSGLEQHTADLREALERLKFNGSQPATKTEWQLVLRALNNSRALHAFESEVWKVHGPKYGWPEFDDVKGNEDLRKLGQVMSKAVETKQIAWKLNVEDEVKMATECRVLDMRRSILSSRMQRLAEDLVDATVIRELSRSFSSEAQSALIRFAQIAGKTKFSRSSQASKMTQRQRRRRQEYLDAFDQCCRFIPCWILTTSQISDYLPSECLFDLVIIDEASQSDVTVLPGMLRGKQWLIVGDGKQVSPTESFISEDQIDSLRAALPATPLHESLLPGQSFFDLCSQAFPKGRVVLSEHFRCAEEIIDFSNQHFYDGRLVPLRLPTKSERLSPSIIDVKVRDGVKVGKVNEREADEVVRLVRDVVNGPSANANPRSIGIISLVGDEQSRLIRGRLLDAIGPQLMARHNVLVGDPPTFQGAERDIIFLSMVCSRGSAPTQCQLMHVQRANVAMSRARDRSVLVRSIELTDIPNRDDIKLPIIEFFQSAHNSNGEPNDDDRVDARHHEPFPVRSLLEKLLKERGFAARSMGVVWKNALCVEHRMSDTRAALIVDCAGEDQQEWQASYNQQKAIERVGWKCMRVDALSLLNDFHGTMQAVVRFLASAGIEEPVVLYDQLEEENSDDEAAEMDIAAEEEEEDESQDSQADAAAADQNAQQEVVVISSDEEGDTDEKMAAIQPDAVVASGSFEAEDDHFDASQFGQVVELDFLRGGGGSRENAEADFAQLRHRVSRNEGSSTRDEEYQDEEYQGDLSDMDDSTRSRTSKRRRRTYRRLDKYSRDGRWYPGSHLAHSYDDEVKNWYDTDSDLDKHREESSVQEEEEAKPKADRDEQYEMEKDE